MSQEGMTLLRERIEKAKKAGNRDLYIQLKQIADCIEGEHLEDVRDKCERLEKQRQNLEGMRKHLQDRTEELHAVQLACERHKKTIKDLEPSEGWIELPKDSEGQTIHVGDTVRCFAILGDGIRSETRCMGEVSSMALCTNDAWMLFIDGDKYNEGGGQIAKPWMPAYCELVKAPYDKHGRTIEAGMWVKYDNSKPASEVYSIEQDSVFYDEYDLYSRAGCMAGVFFAWSPERANEVEIVPEPDTQDRLESDVVDIAKSIAEDARRGLAQESVIERLIIACLARQKALDGVSS